MPTTTTNYSLYKPLVADPIDEDLWGGYLNDDMDDIDTLLRQGITLENQASQVIGFTATVSISVKYLYPCDATGGAFAATLPTAASAGDGAIVYFQKTDASANAVTITRAGADTIDGATTYALTSQYGVAGLVSDGVSKWSKIASSAAVFTGDSGSGGAVGLVPAPAAGDTAAKKVLLASGAWGTRYVQESAATPYTTNTAISTTIPLDDTIPQNSEGTEILTVSITPTTTTSRIIVEWVFYGSTANSNVEVIAALFKDSTASAVAVSYTTAFNNQFPVSLQGSYEEVSGSTAARTFKVRVGASSGDLYPNGNTGASRYFGGISAARLRVYEVAT